MSRSLAEKNDIPQSPRRSCPIPVAVRLLVFAVLACGGLASPASADPRFVAAQDVVTDEQTGLVWQRCSLGQRWDRTHCAGRMAFMPWLLASEAGHDGWRLPTVAELRTLLDDERKAQGRFPTIDTRAFPDMGGGPLDYWTSERRHRPEDPPERAAMTVSFASAANNDVWWRGLEWNLPARLVRGVSAKLQGQAAVSTMLRTTPDGRFTLTGDVAFDRSTGLSWQRCSVGQWLTAEGVCGGVPHAYSLEESRGLGNAGWRLPTVDELKTLLDRRRREAPLIYAEAFPTTPADPHDFWTSTSYSRDGRQVWCVSFAIAAAENCGAYAEAARLVRSGH